MSRRHHDERAAERAEIDEKVRLLVAEALGRPASDVTLDASLMGDLGADSLDFLDIVFSSNGRSASRSRAARWSAPPAAT